jgi:hypothetical protein
MRREMDPEDILSISKNGKRVLRSVPNAPSEEGDGYRSIDLSEQAEVEGWETRMRIQAMELYELPGAAPPLEGELGQKEQDKLRLQEMHRKAEAKRKEREREDKEAPKVGGEELKRMIMGIGPRPEGTSEKEMESDSTDSESELEK